MPQRQPSELEACVLALISSTGPATPYAIRQVFLNSPNPTWSGSTGSLYPLVDRLIRRKLIRATAHSTGLRAGKLLTITPAGRRAVEEWLQPAQPNWVAGVPPDPLRTRIRFLASLQPAKQKAFLQSAQKAVEMHLAEMRRDYPQRRAKGGFELWMASGALSAMRARLSWLRQLVRAVGSHPPSRYT
jgi:DNA-binding PadR family transcriptional regulator